jgi:hypothetical protein
VSAHLRRALGRFSDVSPSIRNPQGTDPDFGTLGLFCTPLMIAAHKGHATAVELLLAAGADVATKSSCVPPPPPPLHLPHAPSPTRPLPALHPSLSLCPLQPLSAFAAKASLQPTLQRMQATQALQACCSSDAAHSFSRANKAARAAFYWEAAQACTLAFWDPRAGGDRMVVRCGAGAAAALGIRRRNAWQGIGWSCVTWELLLLQVEITRDCLAPSATRQSRPLHHLPCTDVSPCINFIPPHASFTTRVFPRQAHALTNCCWHRLPRF